MDHHFKLLQHIRLSNKLLVNFACNYSEDGRIFLVSNEGIYILTLTCDVTNQFSDLNLKKDFIELNYYSLSDHLDVDINAISDNLKREQLYETVLRPELSSNLKFADKIPVHALYAEWSPRGLRGKTDCVLAVLSNLHNLEIYGKSDDELSIVSYISIKNVTKEIIEHSREHWRTIYKNFNTAVRFGEFKNRVEMVSPTAFTWGHKFEIDGVLWCALFVGHMNGNITIWRLKSQEINAQKEATVHYLGRFTLNMKHITTMHWHQTNSTGGGLSVGDIEGRMSVVNVTSLNDEKAFVHAEICFWDEVDEIKVDKITVMSHETYTFVILVKQSYLIIYGLTEEGDVFDRVVYNAGHIYVTGVYHYKNILLIMTLTGVFKHVTLSVDNNRIVTEEKIIPLKIDFIRYRTHGMFYSKHRSVLGILASPCRSRDFAKGGLFVNVFLFQNNSIKPFESLMENEDSLRDQWEFFELLRVQSLKEKQFPWVGIKQNINYDNLSLQKLKTLRLIAKMSESVYNSVATITSYEIKPYILLHYLVDIKNSVERINRLLNLKNSGVELTDFQMQSIDIQSFFLKEMVLKDVIIKAAVGDRFIDDIIHILTITNELQYPDMPQCQWCGEKIIGLSCVPPHADSRCAISMMPMLLIPGYKCPYCGCLAHKEMDKEYDIILCPYCDIPMEQRYMEDKIKNEIENTEERFKETLKDATRTSPSGVVLSDCYEDCLKEEISFEDVEDNDIEYVVFSDDEDDESVANKTSNDQVRQLYFHMQTMSLQDAIDLTNKDNDNGHNDEMETG